MTYPSLTELGHRISIIGHSCAGKSTLANRLANKLSTQAYHLDQLAHIPDTNWKRRPDSEFIAEHDAVIQKESWVIDGIYSICVPQRLQKATGLIWIDLKPYHFLWRYLKRSFFDKNIRYGGLKGMKKEFTLTLIHYTLTQYPKKRPRYQKFFDSFEGTKIKITNPKELDAYYKNWGISL